MLTSLCSTFSVFTLNPKIGFFPVSQPVYITGRLACQFYFKDLVFQIAGLEPEEYPES
jgi:hypothetical protein